MTSSRPRTTKKTSIRPIERLKQLNHVPGEASISSKKAQGRQAKSYDGKRRDVEYEVGNRVWKRNRTLSSAPDKVAAKLAPKYEGPHSIAASLSSNVYELVDERNNDAGKAHVVDLGPYKGGRKPDPDESIVEAPTHTGEALTPERIMASSSTREKRNTAAAAAKK